MPFAVGARLGRSVLCAGCVGAAQACWQDGAVIVASEVRVRRAVADDLDAIVALAGEALGWDPQQPNGAWIRWKLL